MLGAVRDVANGLMRDFGEEVYFPLEIIANAVEAYSSIDQVIYVEYDVPESNPICGQFRKYGYAPAAYAGARIVVEVRYAKHLTKPWRRFVVAKELCHALETDKATHSANGRAMDRLLSRFALYSAEKPISTSFPAFDAEGLAEIGALELLCPLIIRDRIKNENTHASLCEQYGIPAEYAKFAFDEEYLEIFTSIFEETC